MSRMPAGILREAVIDTSAITANVRQLRRLTASEIIAVVIPALVVQVVVDLVLVQVRGKEFHHIRVGYAHWQHQFAQQRLDKGPSLGDFQLAGCVVPEQNRCVGGFACIVQV